MTTEHSILPNYAKTHDLTWPAQGYGAMGLTGSYGETDPRSALATLNHAVDRGIFYIDTANVYGNGTNEELVGQLLRQRRDEVFVATKVGIQPNPETGTPQAQGDPAYIAANAEQSLRRLGVDTIDLYYYHRVDARVPIEETVGAFADLVGRGLVRHIGLSEVTAAELRRAQEVHPIAAVQSEWSIFSRDVEGHVVDAVNDVGAVFVAYAPLGRGLLAGSVASTNQLPATDARRNFPRFDEEHFDSNLKLARQIREVADDEGITPAQVALSWVYQQAQVLSVHVVPIPGTRSAERVDENLAAAQIRLSDASFGQLASVAERVVGGRARDLTYVSHGREESATRDA